jgi:hypothetical protein
LIIRKKIIINQAKTQYSGGRDEKNIPALVNPDTCRQPGPG